MLKKLLSIALLAVFAIILCACDNNQNNPSGGGATTPEDYEYKTPQTDAVKLNASYEGKDFIEDGIGVVTVSQYVDGDTTMFVSTKGHRFSTRYTGVNTPESTYKVEPWGFAASNYTKSALKGASKIVLEASDMMTRTDNNDRYLAWVWLIDEEGDSRLLNLELVELAYGFSKANDTIYEKQFSDAVYPVTKAKCRIYGEKDPDYDYSTEGSIISIKELREQYDTFEKASSQADKGKVVIISGVVTRMNGTASCYLQQYDEETNQYYGIYVYGGFTQKAEFSVGNSVVLKGKIGYYFGSLQITDVSNIKLRSWADTTSWETRNQSVNLIEVTDTSLLSMDHPEMVGRLINLKNVSFTGGSNSENNAFTIRTSLGIDVRVNNEVSLWDEDGNRIVDYNYFVGKTAKSINVLVGYYDYDSAEGDMGRIQLLLTTMVDIEF